VHHKITQENVGALGSGIRDWRRGPQPFAIQASQSFSAVLRRSPQLRDSFQRNDADPAATALNTNGTNGTDRTDKKPKLLGCGATDSARLFEAIRASSPFQFPSSSASPMQSNPIRRAGLTPRDDQARPPHLAGRAART